MSSNSLEMSEKWEFVVKGSKSKVKSQMSTKEIEQIKINNLNSNEFGPGFNEASHESTTHKETKASPRGVKGKARAGLKVDGRKNLSQQINKLNGDSIKGLYTELMEKCHNKHTVVLMDLALHLNVMLKECDDSPSNTNFDNIDFPHGLLSFDVKSALRIVFNDLNNVQLDNFMRCAMMQIIHNNEKNIKSVGLLMLVQVCMRTKPAVVISNKKWIFDLMNTYREHTVKFKIVTWILKQACLNASLTSQVWLVYLLPFINQKCHTETVLQFGEEMMNHPSETCGYNCAVPAADLLPLIDLVFDHGVESSADVKEVKKKTGILLLTQSHMQRIGVIYRSIKECVFASGSLKEYVAAVFLRLSPKKDRLNAELLDYLDHCLTSCPEYITQLGNVYFDYPHQTRIFIDHFSSSKNTMTKQKTYKAMLDKTNSVNNVAFAPKTSTQKQARDNKRTKSGSLCKVALYTAMSVLLVSLSLRQLWPQHYDTLMKGTRSVSEFATSTAAPYYAYLEPYLDGALTQLKTRSSDAWTASRPHLVYVAAQAEQAGLYLYAKLDELAPSGLKTMTTMYASVDKYVTDRYDGLTRYLNSAQFQDMVKVASDRAASVAQQVRGGYREAVTFVVKVVGY